VGALRLKSLIILPTVGVGWNVGIFIGHKSTCGVYVFAILLKSPTIEATVGVCGDFG